MKKLLTLTSITLVSMATLLGSGITTFANDDEPAEAKHNVETDAKIQFESNTDETEVIPPGGGDKVDIESTGPDNNGPLAIAYAPTLDFGTHNIKVQDTRYHLIAETHNEKGGTAKVPFVSFAQVQDTRGTNEGWNLRVTQSAFTSDRSSEQTNNTILQGAQIEFNGGTLDYDGLDKNNEPTVRTNFNLTPEAGRTIMSAEQRKGAGTSSIVWGDQTQIDADHVNPDIPVVKNSAIQLFVPRGAAQDNTTYTATLTWELVSGPGNLAD